MKVIKWFLLILLLYGLVIRLNSVLIAVIFGLTCFTIGVFVDRKGHINRLLDRIKWVKKEEN